MAHFLIIFALFMLAVVLHPFLGWHHAGYGPFFGALGVLIVVSVLRSVGII